MKIVSRWKLTLDPSGSATVLLAFGDLLDDELGWNLGRMVEVVPLAAAAAPFLRPAGNNSYTLEFTAYKTESSDLAARKAMMDELAATDDLPKKPLRLEVATEDGPETGFYYQFASAVVSGETVMRDIDSSRPRWGRKFTITAVKLTKTTL